MQNIVFKDKIKLEQRQNGYGSHPEPQTVAENEVWACVCLPSMTSKVNAQSVGIKSDFVIHLYRNEFESGSYTHVFFNDKRYKIESVTTSSNNLFVKITVSRV